MSKLVLIWSGIVTLSAGTALLAQAPQEKAATGVVATITATGCLESTAGLAEKPPAGAKFVLTHVDGRTASATSGEAGKTEKTGPETRYLLLPDPKLDVAAHLNHRVKIVGTIAPQPSEGASLTEIVTDPASRETNLPGGAKPEGYQYNLVDVSSLTMVSGSCKS